MFEKEYTEKELFFRDNVVMRISDIKAEINNILAYIEEVLIKEKKISDVYCNAIKRLIIEFVNELDQNIFMNRLDEFWSYDYSFSSKEIALLLMHYRVEEDFGGEYVYYPDQIFKLLSVSPQFLTADEYASRYGIETGTVRQWIRRGKIRTAVKWGTDWRIPELEAIPKKGFSNARYKWEREKVVFDGEFEYLAAYDSVAIKRCKEEKNQYRLSLYLKKNKIKELFFDTKQREKLEAYLIGNSDVTFCDEREDFMITLAMKSFKAQLSEEEKD